MLASATENAIEGDKLLVSEFESDTESDGVPVTLLLSDCEDAVAPGWVDDALGEEV